MSKFTEWVDGVTGGVAARWRAMSIINKTRVSTGALCFAVGFLAGAVIL